MALASLPFWLIVSSRGAQPGLQRVDHRPAAVLADGAALLGRAAADVGLHRVELADALERLRGDRRRAGGGQLVEAPTHMAPAEGEPHMAPIR